MSKGYNSNNLLTNSDQLDFFLESPITGNLLDVPGLGISDKKKLRYYGGIQTTYQLIGKFLSFKKEDIEYEKLCSSFYNYLANAGVNENYRSAIVQAIAEKTRISFPDIYEEDCSDEENCSDEEHV